MTTSSVDESYGAIERAYGQGQFKAALAQAEALLIQVGDAEQGDALPQRLNLLMGHIHFYGLGNAAAAQAHYETVVRSAPDSTLAQLARGSLEQCQSRSPEVLSRSSPEPMSDPGEIPAVPWLNQLENSRQALAALQQAWATVITAPPPRPAPLPEAADAAATPWSPTAKSPDEGMRPMAEPTPQPTAEPKVEPPTAPRLDFAQGSLLVRLKPASTTPTDQKKACLQEGQATVLQRWRKALSWRRSGGGGSAH